MIDTKSPFCLVLIVSLFNFNLILFALSTDISYCMYTLFLDCHVHLYLGVWLVVMETKVLQLEVLNVGHWSGDLQSRERAGPTSQLDKRLNHVSMHDIMYVLRKDTLGLKISSEHLASL